MCIQEYVMPARFTATQNAFEKGIENTKPNAAVKMIQGWEDELAKTDVSGAKGIAGDLESLRKALEKEEPDGGRITRLLGELAESIKKIAGRVEDEKIAAKLEELGGALENSGEMAKA
jgi:hypothetical protein